jgi:nucleotide-binding universal stress UspA family protein
MSGFLLAVSRLKVLRDCLTLPELNDIYSNDAVLRQRLYGRHITSLDPVNRNAREMSRIKKIMVASDLSQRAEYALSRSMLLADELDADLEALHVVPICGPEGSFGPPLSAGSEPLVSQSIEVARQELDRQATALSGKGSVKINISIEAGKDFITIIRHARKIHADLIIIGAHGEGFIKEVFLGTIAEKIIRKGDRPILVVKKPPEAPYRRVLVPVDFSEACLDGFKHALLLAPDASFHIFHAYQIGGEKRAGISGTKKDIIAPYHEMAAEYAHEQIRLLLRKFGLESRGFEQSVEHGQAASQILKKALQWGADLVAIGTLGRTGLPHILLGSVAEHVLRRAECDVLTGRPEVFLFEPV